MQSVKGFFKKFVASEDDGKSHSLHGVQVATAALLIEMVRADYEQSVEELTSVHENLRQHFQLTESESEQLFQLAEKTTQSSACLHEFTSLINQNFSKEEKIQIIEMLWRVALADNVLDKYEESLVRKVAGLVHVRHKELMQAKHRILLE